MWRECTKDRKIKYAKTSIKNNQFKLKLKNEAMKNLIHSIIFMFGLSMLGQTFILQERDKKLHFEFRR